MSPDQILDMTTGELAALAGQDELLDLPTRVGWWEELAATPVEQIMREYPCCRVFAEWVRGLAARTARHLRSSAAEAV